MPVPQGSPGDRLLESLGYRVRWTSWVLQLPEGATIPERPLPEGYAVRAATEAEHEAVWTVQEDAFLEWAVRERDTFEEWQRQTVRRPGFEPWHLRVVTDPSGEVVAMALVQTERRLRLHRPARHPQGPARPRPGPGAARRLLRRRPPSTARCTSELSTDSRTGALGLYEKVGMKVTSTWVNRAIELNAVSRRIELPAGLTSPEPDPGRRTGRRRGHRGRGGGRPRRGRDHAGGHRRRLAAAPATTSPRTTVGVFDGDRLVGYGDVSERRHRLRRRAPRPPGPRHRHRDRPLGAGDGPRRRRDRLCGQVPEGSAADRLLTDLGYRVRWTAWDLELPEGGEIDARPLPAGFTLRDATEADREAAWTLLEDAFLEWSERDRRRSRTSGAGSGAGPATRPGTSACSRTPTASSSARPTSTSPTTPGTSRRSPSAPTTAGAAWPRRCWSTRSRLAREHGARRCYLSTDTRAGARTLYEKVGMVVASTWVNRAIDL